MRKIRLLAIALAAALIFGGTSVFAAPLKGQEPLDSNSPRLSYSYKCIDGKNYNELSFNLTGLSDADIVLDGFAYDPSKVYTEEQKEHSEQWVVSGNTLYELRFLEGGTPGSYYFPEGVEPDYTGSYFYSRYELVPTIKIPKKSMITKEPHLTAKDVVTTKYLVNGKEVSKAAYDKAKTGAYTEKRKKSFTGYGKETIEREDISFVKLIKIKQVGPGADDAPWSATFEFRNDQYITTEMNYLETYEIVKDDSSSSTPSSPSGKTKLNNEAKKKAEEKVSTNVVIDAPTVSAAVVNKALAKKGLSKASVKTITLGKNVKKIKGSAFKGYKNAKTVIIKSKKLKKATVKNSLKGSKITSVSVKVGTAKANKSYVKKYKKFFTKKNAGKKVKIS